LFIGMLFIGMLFIGMLFIGMLFIGMLFIGMLFIGMLFILLKIRIWDKTPRSLVDRPWRFGRTCWLYLKGRTVLYILPDILLHSEKEYSWLFRNVGTI
jgi:hypothetical protein